MGLLGEHDGDLGGMALDSVALIDLGELRFQWFDYVFRDGPKPAILADKVNFQMMGSDQWRHVPTIDAMNAGRTRLYIGNNAANPVLATEPADEELSLVVDLADRTDAPVDRTEALLTDTIDGQGGIVLRSAPFANGAEISGLFGAHLVFTTNKRDFDIRIQLYEQTAAGRYLRLGWLLQRASQARDRSQRNLLVPGRTASLDLVSQRVTARRFAPGSRLVAVMSIPKGPGEEINLGSGNPVSGESVADAGAPLRIAWQTASYLDLPITSGWTSDL